MSDSDATVSWPRPIFVCPFQLYAALDTASANVPFHETPMGLSPSLEY